MYVAEICDHCSFTTLCYYIHVRGIEKGLYNIFNVHYDAQALDI